MKSLKFIYNETTINFTSTNSDIMVNATEMAKVFNREVSGFSKIDSTKNFVEAYCRAEDLPSEHEFSSDGKVIRVVKSGRNNGTWMNRILALKFAAWLDSEFEVWVWKTIDEIIMGHYREVKEATLQKIALEQKRNKMRAELLTQYPAFVDFLELEGQINTEEKKRLKALRAATSQLRFEFSEKQM